MKERVIPLRGHHLSRINAFDIDRESYGKLLVDTGYSECPNDFFATQTFDFLQQLRKQPSQKILVTQGEPDYICGICNKNLGGECADYNPQSHLLYGSCFWDAVESPKDRDIDSAHKAGLKIGDIYSVAEIIRATEEETRRFMSSLEDC